MNAILCSARHGYDLDGPNKIKYISHTEITSALRVSAALMSRYAQEILQNGEVPVPEEAG